MNQNKLDKFRLQLRRLSERMEPDVVAVTEQARGASGGQAAGDLSNAPMHLGDMGTEEYLQDLNATLLVNESYLLNEARDALRRIEQGEYGNCEHCGEPISDERLEAVPYTRFCIRCADVATSAPDVNLNSGRPRSPADTLAPEGEIRKAGRRPMETLFTDADLPEAGDEPERDVHAVGTAGGGTAVGGLAGTNIGNGEPDTSELQDAMGNGAFDLSEAQDDEDGSPRSGRAGGAVGGTPAGKRTNRE